MKGGSVDNLGSSNKGLNEKPKKLEQSESFDSQMIYGQDTHGNSLLIKLTRRMHRSAEVWLIFRLQDGRTFTLPDHPDTQAVSENEETFNAAGLSFECLVPFMSWRIRFNGLLRQGVRSEWSADVKDKELITVKFNFMWSAKSGPLHWPSIESSSPIARSLSSIEKGQLARFTEEGYDQYGAMLGEGFVGSGDAKEQFEINLPGLRQRRWGTIGNGSPYASIIGVFGDGLVFNAREVKGSGSTGTYCGNISFPSGRLEWIDSINFNGKVVEFKVGKERFSVSLSDQKHFPLFGTKPSPWKSECYHVSLAVNGATGSGIQLFCVPSDVATGVPKLPLYLRVGYCDEEPRKDKFIYHFDDPEASSVLISGGKGASLALLTSISKMKDIVDQTKVNLKAQEVPNFTVPSGFVLSVSAMDAMIDKSSSLNSHIDLLVQLCAHGNEFKDQCEAIKKEIESLQLTADLQSSIHNALSQISFPSAYLRMAIRSSSVCEDGEDVSAAGQNDTFLGLRTEDDILKAVKQCWASLYSYQSVHYRKQNIQPIRTGMAVVFQQMLAADCAGVLFSQHPITGDRKQCLISANYGLGESVVSGEVDPDNYVVQRSYWDDKYTLVEKVRGQKGYKIQMSGDSVEKIKVEGEEEFCLSDAMVLKLAEIGVVLEKLYGNGRDIEWGLKEDRIYLLQSRPITSLNAFSDFELIHEFDTPTMTEENQCTTATVQEVMPGALCPLTRHFILESMESSIAVQLSGGEEGDPYNRFMTIARHHVFMDLFKGLLYGIDSEEVPLDKRVMSITICGYDIITPENHKIALKRAEPMPNKGKMFWEVLKNCWNCKSIAKDTMNLAMAFKSQYTPQQLAKFNRAQDLFVDINRNIKTLIRVCSQHTTVSLVHSVYNRVIMSMLTEGQKHVTDELMDDYKLISSSAKDTISADIPKKLETMAKGIFMTGNKAEFCGLDPALGIKWMQENAPRTHQIFAEFIDHNSHRGFQEYDFASTTWGMVPSQIIGMLQALLKHADTLEALGKTNEITEMSASELVGQLKSAKKWKTRWMLKKFISLSETAVQYREKTKYSFILVIHQFRLAFWHLGVMMEKEGYLPNKDLIFQVTGRELQQLFETRDVNVVKKATRRVKIIAQLKKERYEDILRGVPKPNNFNKTLSFEAGTEIKGTSVYGGIITGRACVIHEFSEVSKIQPGDILITYSTDIGWSPYFPILGGVVTEIGGLISHGAVVAREYGLPCVVSATNAVDFFVDGETVTLDAARGVIFKGTGN